jgi:hypothetical protein
MLGIKNPYIIFLPDIQGGPLIVNTTPTELDISLLTNKPVTVTAIAP